MEIFLRWIHETLPQWFWVAWPWIKAVGVPLLVAFIFLTMFWDMDFFKKRKRVFIWGTVAFVLIATLCLRFFVFQPEASGTEKQTGVTEVVQQDQQIVAEETGQASSKGQGSQDFKEWLMDNLSKWQFDLSIALVVLWVISVYRAWTNSFYRDWRLGENNPPFPKNWPVIFSAVGFPPFAIASLWWPHLALFVLTFVFWRIGPIFAITVPDTEKHVPKVFARSFWADGMKDWFWLGLEGPNYHNPFLAFFMLIVSLPAWLPFYSITVLSRGRLDKKYPISAQAKDGPVLASEIRVQGELCYNVQTFMRLFSESERKESIEAAGCGEIAQNLVADVTRQKPLEEVQSNIDVMWKDATGGISMAQIFADRVLKDKGHFIESSDFGMPKVSEEMRVAQEVEVIAKKNAAAKKVTAKADAYAIRKKLKAEADGEAAKVLAPAQALVDASSDKMTLVQARQSIVDETEAKATRTVIKGNAVPLVNLPPQS